MKHIINKLLIVSFVALFTWETSAYIDESQDSIATPKKSFPKLRVINIDVSDYSDEYSDALSNDPVENVNRAIFGFNKTVDDYFLAPVARGYRYSVPQWGRDRVSDFFNNLGEPANFVNSILQGDVESTFRSFWRFAINSTFGIVGIHDVAAGFGLQEKEKGFSQTLALYGVGSGPYVVFPFLGPSTLRDLFSNGADGAADPSNYISNGWVSFAANASEIVSVRERLLDITDEVELSSFDLYSTYKSLYLQRRKSEVLSTLE